jgi:YVTN family beta-propeller protein
VTMWEVATSSTKHTPSEQNPHITVGKTPAAIDVNLFENKIYVANYGDGTVSVIDGITNTKIGDDIKVGNRPVAIASVDYLNKIYILI